jgi:glycosyltransferase involved in cell wall biosynthesis
MTDNLAPQRERTRFDVGAPRVGSAFSEFGRSEDRRAGRPVSRLIRPAWLDEFEQEHGRPLRVLHIGNIANNAYNNAKILRKIGVEADVMCHNYYHMMGTPEWEDANFIGKHGDDFFPDWWRVDLNGFQRPTWFFQGPRELCFDAVNAKFVDPGQFKRAFTQLELATSLICYRRSKLRDGKSSSFDRKAHRRRRRAFAAYVAKTVSANRMEFARLSANIASAWARTQLVRPVRRRLSRPSELARAAVTWQYRRIAAPFFHAAGRAFVRATGRKFSTVFGTGARDAMLSAAGQSIASAWRRVRCGLDAPLDAALTPEQPASWIAEHLNWHAGVEPEVLQQDLVLAGAYGDGWKPILKHYDVVQCYSVDGIIPMSHGRRDYLCYEHGTLRSIPFEPTPIGRLTATAYRLGARSFVTNLDNLQSCRRLKLAGERVVPLPHALDDEKIHAFARQHAGIRPSGHDAPEFLSPSRQHWLDKDPNLAKGNDIFFDALARLKAQGYRARVTLVAWGRDLEASKTYVRDIGIEDFVTWVPPMTGEELWKRYLGCHAVVDQFIIPAFGRVTFDSLLLGKPVITNLDVDLATEFFTVAPPILVSATVDDAERALKRILDDPEDKQGLGAASAAWAATYHSTQRILDLQVEAYRQTIAEHMAKAAEKPTPGAIG